MDRYLVAGVSRGLGHAMAQALAEAGYGRFSTAI
jgi:NAD(P)-dependent dehydrogenase (short-subunit alcohol dehydrogenase family)